MATRSRAELKQWFKRGMYPTESQFADLIDSLFHKGEDTISISHVESLSEVLNRKAESQTVEELTQEVEELQEILQSQEDIGDIDDFTESFHEGLVEGSQFASDSLQ